IPVEDCGWSDIGNLKVWIELVESTHDKQQNHICLDCEDTNVFTDQGLVVTVGVKNLIVVKKDDVVLICDKDRVNDVGKIPGILVEKGLDQYI
ncbi:MAG: hypothetical protein NZO16_04735, partial [Deltaproteobacteria bacterium]|nr:hypothetical protein [Deltaproteobacteria bacterium]